MVRFNNLLTKSFKDGSVGSVDNPLFVEVFNVVDHEAIKGSFAIRSLFNVVIPKTCLKAISNRYIV